MLVNNLSDIRNISIKFTWKISSCLCLTTIDMASLHCRTSICVPYHPPSLKCYAPKPQRMTGQRRFSVNNALSLQERYTAIAVQGTGRSVMEDTVSTVVDPKGSSPSFFGVFDGHGGPAVAEMLKEKLWPVYKNKLSGSNLVEATMSTYFEVDQQTLAQPKGLFGGLRERGVGGSQCGSTAATLVLLPSEGCNQILVAANVGDSRVVLSRAGKAMQLTVDHKPNVEGERKRIEAKNPTPKKPLVVNIGGTWRLGGLLSLSRAFGDAFLKDWEDGKIDGAKGGFGLTAEPHVTVETLLPEDQLIILGTDGLWEHIDNQEVVDLCLSRGKDILKDTVKLLIKLAQERGIAVLTCIFETITKAGGDG